MHVVIFILYGMTAWLGMMLYAAMAGGEYLWTVFWLGPFIVSGAVIVLAAIDFTIYWLVDRHETPNKAPAE